jgi:hypothetical protein
MDTNQNHVGRNFWLQWVSASFLGFAIGGVLGGFTMFAFSGDLWILGFALFGAMFGAAGGIMQWMVLRRYIIQIGGWVLATTVGYSLAALTTALSFSLPSSDVAVVGLVVFGTVAGIVCGIWQWFVLRQRVAHAGWWVLASILGLIVGMGIGGPVAMSLGQAGRVIEPTIVFGVLFGLGVGAIPGAVLVWLLRQSESGSSERIATRGAQ